LLTWIEEEFKLPLELRFENGRGYYLRLSTLDLEDKALPGIFINAVDRKKMVEFTTLELVKRNAKVYMTPCCLGTQLTTYVQINDSLTEVMYLSMQSLSTVLTLLTSGKASKQCSH